MRRIRKFNMKICNLSLDNNVLKSGSLVQKRLLSLAEMAGEITLFVPGETDESKKNSEHLTVYSVGGAKFIQFFKLWRKAKEIVNKDKFDLITVQDTSFLALIGFFLAKRFKIPFEIQVHGLEKFYGIRKLIAGFVLSRAAKVRAVSHRLVSTLTETYNLKPNTFYVLPVYTQIVAPTEIPNRVKVETNKQFTFLTVGRLVRVKNTDLQIRAFAELVKEFPNTRLVIVGSGELEGSLKSKVKSLKLEGKVNFEGRQENLERYYKEADAFLITSNAEGWGVVVTEAAAYGLPIVMTNVGLAGEFIKSEENGIVIPVGNEKALVTAMKRVIRDESLRKKLSFNVRQSFEVLPDAKTQIKRQVEEWAKIV